MPVPPNHGYLQANGFDVHYLVAGEGPPAVLVHGEGASALDWQWTIPAVSRLLQVYALDLPGHGDSAKPPAPYSAGLLTDTLVSFLDAVDIHGAVLVGHSLGGLVAARAARRRPDRVSALCLLDSGGLGRYIHPSNVIEGLPGVGELSQLAVRTLAGRLNRAWLRAALLYARWWRIQPAWLTEQLRLARLAGFPEANLTINRATVDVWGQKESIFEDLRQITVPTLVVWGAEDVIVPIWHAYSAVAALPDGHLEVLPTCGHMPHVECPKAFADSLSSFLVERKILKTT